MENNEEEVCEYCKGTGICDEDEYENGQLVGVGTLSNRCICQIDLDDHD